MGRHNPIDPDDDPARRLPTDGARFDRLARSLGAAPSRRRLLGGLGLLAGALLGRGASAQGVGVETCRERLGSCDRRDRCCEAASDHRIGCAGVSEFCSGEFAGGRCCGRGGARCADSCACCAGYACRDGACRPIEACEPNACCDCVRCDEQTGVCEPLSCATGLSRRRCERRCRRQGGEAFVLDGRDFFGEGGARFECRGRGGCALGSPRRF